MFLMFTNWVKQLLFSGLNWIQAPSYLSGWWIFDIQGEYTYNKAISQLIFTHDEFNQSYDDSSLLLEFLNYILADILAAGLKLALLFYLFIYLLEQSSLQQ